MLTRTCDPFYDPELLDEIVASMYPPVLALKDDKGTRSFIWLLAAVKE
jgi:hypothetical protein